MIALQVSDMTSARCAGAVTKALKAADHAALVRVDLATFTVEIARVQHVGATLEELRFCYYTFPGKIYGLPQEK